VKTAVRSTCAYCGVGCGVTARKVGDGVEVRGDREHPANLGALCSKGSALGETVGHEGRLLHPQIRGWRASWDRALDEVANRFASTIAEHGPDSVAFYVSGQLLTEDYYVANKLMKGYLGSANIDTNSRLCMSSSVAAHQRAFGEDVVPGCYEDFELADLVVLVGSNAAWCHPVLFQRIVKAKQRRPSMRLVVIDPRRTATCEAADLHLPIRSGADVHLFNGLLAFLRSEGAVDERWMNEHTTGAADAFAVAEENGRDLTEIARSCGLDPTDVEKFYRLFADTERVVTAYSQGVHQSSSGTDKVSAIVNCHLATGRIGRPGMGPFSLTGQPNAMGGREVGGMANMLAAHLSLEDEDHRAAVQGFWASPAVASRPGLKAVDLFEAVRDRRIRALWIMATNPAVSLPDADRVRAAIARCEFVVVSDCVARTDTTVLADVLLPAAAWGEKDGTTTNSERCITRQRAFLKPPGEAKPDWWMVTEVARRMGFAEAFAYESAHEVFDEHARLSALAASHGRAFDIGGLAGMTRAEYDSMEPLRWPLPTPGHPGTERLFGDGRFSFVDGKARLVATAPRDPVHAVNARYPFVLNTGRVRDQWHTRTRTGTSPRLNEHLPEPYVDVHADDIETAGLAVGALARVFTRWGSVVMRVRSSGEVARGTLFVPIHWSSMNASDARVGALVNPVVDPLSGEPELKHTPAAIAPFEVAWQGFVLTRKPLAHVDAAWWTHVRGRGYHRYEIAGLRTADDADAWARDMLGARDAADDVIQVRDGALGIQRAALVVDDRLAACVFVSAGSETTDRTWMGSLFAKDKLADEDRMALLAGRPLGGCADAGPLVCSCFGVRRGTIEAAIVDGGLDTAAQVGSRVRAGTNCGSCVPEIQAILAAVARGRAAAA
jgi:assimilatory nitrate reductase catalytic subunit